MAEGYPTPNVTSNDTPSVHESTSTHNPSQEEFTALKQEVMDLRAALGSLAEKFGNTVQVKVEATTPVKIEVKDEPLEPELGNGPEEVPSPARQEDPPHDEQMEADAPHSSNVSGQVASVPTQRLLSPSEPPWDTPPIRENLYRVDPEYARRVAARKAAAAQPISVPTPPPPLPPRAPSPPPPLAEDALPPPRNSPSPPPPLQPNEEAPPSPRSPSPPPTVITKKPIGIIPLSQLKRKHNFELIIEVPAKRFKASNYPAQNSSTGPTASSSRDNADDESVVVVTRAPAPTVKTFSKAPVRKILTPAFNVQLDPRIKSVIVTRTYLSAHFGASPARQFCEPEQAMIDRHGYDHFVFINKSNTPQAPSAPGRSGFVTFFEEHPFPEREFHRIFVRVRSDPFEWQYMGLYKATKLPAWTPGEIKQFQMGVKNHWATTVRKSRWGRPILARITLREQLGRKPTSSEVKRQVHRIEGKSVELPPLNTIVEAFDSGAEKLFPLRLDCVDYEESLQWEISITYPRFKKEAQMKKAEASRMLESVATRS